MFSEQNRGRESPCQVPDILDVGQHTSFSCQGEKYHLLPAKSTVFPAQERENCLDNCNEKRILHSLSEKVFQKATDEVLSLVAAELTLP